MRRLRGAAGVAAVGVFAAGLAFVSLTPADYIGIRSPGEFSKLGSDKELAAYGAAYDLAELLARVDQPDARVFAWTSMTGDANIVWVDMPHQLGGIQDAEKPVPLTQLTPAEVDTLRHPTTRGVLVFDENAAAVDGAAEVLRRSGFRTVEREHGAWADGRLRYVLLDLVEKPR
jgi:hypothetical protein